MCFSLSTFTISIACQFHWFSCVFSHSHYCTFHSQPPTSTLSKLTHVALFIVFLLERQKIALLMQSSLSYTIRKGIWLIWACFCLNVISMSPIACWHVAFFGSTNLRGGCMLSLWRLGHLQCQMCLDFTSHPRPTFTIVTSSSSLVVFYSNIEHFIHEHTELA